MAEVIYLSADGVPKPSRAHRVMVVADAEVPDVTSAQAAFVEFQSTTTFKDVFYRDISAKLVAGKEDIEFVLGVHPNRGASVYPLKDRLDTVSGLRNSQTGGPMFDAIYLSDKPLIEEANALHATDVVVPITTFGFNRPEAVRERIELLSDGQPERTLISSRKLSAAARDERLMAELGTNAFRHFAMQFQGLGGTEIFNLFYPNHDAIGPNEATLTIVEQIAEYYRTKKHLRVIDFNSHVGLFASALVLNGVTGIDRLQLLPRSSHAALVTEFNVKRAIRFSEGDITPTVGQDPRIRSKKPYDIIHIAMESFTESTKTQPAVDNTLWFTEAMAPILHTMLNRNGIALCRMPHNKGIAQQVLDKMHSSMPQTGYTSEVLDFPSARYLTLRAN